MNSLICPIKRPLKCPSDQYAVQCLIDPDDKLMLIIIMKLLNEKLKITIQIKYLYWLIQLLFSPQYGLIYDPEL